MTAPLQKVDNIKVYAMRDELYIYVGAYISEYKRVNRVSDKYVASAVGCTKQAIQSVRCGRGGFSSIAFLSRISAVFGMSLLDLMNAGRELAIASGRLPAQEPDF